MAQLYEVQRMTDGICAHLDFDCFVSVTRYKKTGEFEADLTIQCLECGMPFAFVGVPGGISSLRPTTDITTMELRMPIKPLMPAGPIHKNIIKAFEGIRSRQEEGD